jgi:hypothetical protein
MTIPRHGERWTDTAHGYLSRTTPVVPPIYQCTTFERAVTDGAPEQLKRLLDSVVDEIVVESRACIQPYFVAPTVRTRPGSRRRTGIEPA